jgi:hypothetical protein
MIHKLQSLEKELQAFHDETSGETIYVDGVSYNYGDYAGQAIDAINDLIGVLEKDSDYE